MSIAGLLTAFLIYGSASSANFAGSMARMYSPLKYVSLSMSKIAGDLEMPLMSKISDSSPSV
jgi:hypothetical protein